MKLGVVMLVHDTLDRAEQLVRHWSAHGCPVVIHVDKRVKRRTYAGFVNAVRDLENVRFCGRHKCEWGTWSLVGASQTASELMLKSFPDVSHVFLASGSCLPLRPVPEMLRYLEARPRTNFIESVTTEDVPWTVGGLDHERFTLRFPFSWKRHRWLFDRYVALQRKLRFKRKIPDGLVPHLGSQWWCLTRRTLSEILNDPDRETYDRYFKKVWIPDESYYQTLVRLHSTDIESRSLTLSKFDYQGKPHIFYDDHLQLLRRSDCFVARKIWPKAEKLYDSFLSDAAAIMTGAEPNPGKIDRIFSKAVERRTRGRPGLFMQSRFPRMGFENGLTGTPYAIFEGFTEVFEEFEPWLERTIGGRVHGHLYDKERVQFSEGQRDFSGALTDSATLRDYNPRAFLTNLVWSTRGERQSFQFGPADNQAISWDVAKDPNAYISVISGAWAVPLFHSSRNFTDIRREAARLQKIESDHIDILRSGYARARVRIWTLAEFVQNPMEPLQLILDEIGGRMNTRLTEVPNLKRLDGFGQFLQNLKNQGMQPYLMGDYPSGADPQTPTQDTRKPYLIK
ncbi:beta-1,6-N-acetylglucosaminyltransferase [Aliiroseovarius crassostreae]|uniref:Peptide O-xylosyltransferase n=1 Tax=Aliiroseovarius crassostreae TaxID=154981 RepID=A0A9Q9LX78_9RHOB|nr:beta-1,6-N-acetylglucosaminyltransferase [Aliiroseovarius crassostreae]UWP92119.1 beta-1,6-N-acetylglucosaminyltransferase [Aliiroseovarius crassostreae]UWP95267.1 beta-1,6-N-acetylglucosaminyltransferase [Aliiroseovarius crassostreae]UWP98426.1 beta-1,6-N-acetylglucosaminyltransferase [Aliiroseovarius crassostreae]